MSGADANRRGKTRSYIRGTALFSLLLAVFLAGGVGRVVSHARPFVFSNPANALALLSILLGGWLLARLTIRNAPRPAWAWCGFGIMAAWLGAGLEAGIRDLWLDGSGGGSVFAPTLLFSLARLFALWLVVAFLRIRGALRDPIWRPRVALAVGLAFGLTSELLLWEQQLVRRVELLPNFGFYVLQGVASVTLGAFSGMVLGGAERPGGRSLAALLLAQILLVGGAVPAGVLALRLPDSWAPVRALLALLFLIYARVGTIGSPVSGRRSSDTVQGFDKSASDR